MPISSSAATLEKKRAFRAQNQAVATSVEHGDTCNTDKNFLTIGPALPTRGNRKKLYKRSHSTLTNTSKDNDLSCDPVTLHSYPDGTVHVTRAQKEKEKIPDRISLDRRGLTVLPVIEGEARLRLLSLQHNLINNLDGFLKQEFPFLVFLDIYDNQLEKICSLDTLDNLRVLLMGKNRIKKIEGLENLPKIEVLDLHGNQIQNITGLFSLSELKVLNLAGNQIRIIGINDLRGLKSLQELNLRRNKLKKLLGFGETTNLQKLFLSNNEIQCVEDMSSIAKSVNIREISVDNNPVSLGGDCVSFFVSYLPQLINLNAMQVTEQVRKAAMAWRRNKENSNAAFMDLTSDVSLNVRREEVISNARTNWELLRSQTKCLAAKASTSSSSPNTSKNIKPHCDFILTSFAKTDMKNTILRTKSKTFTNITSKVPVLPDKKLSLARTSSQDTENSQNTSSSNASSNNEFFRLPPILVPIINKMEQKSDLTNNKESASVKLSGSLSSIGPNVDSSVSSLGSSSSSSQSNSESSNESATEDEAVAVNEQTNTTDKKEEEKTVETAVQELEVKAPSSKSNAETASNISTSTTVSNVTVPSSTSSENCNVKPKLSRNVKSAVNPRTVHAKVNTRASTAKPKKQVSPSIPSAGRDREQGGDYLIEICGRHLNIYGQGALRFVDKPWNTSKANDVNTVNFNYTNFTGITNILSKIKQRFPNADHFVFKETNISCLGQINALAEIQGLTSLTIDKEGNPIIEKDWESYAIYRLSHWGLRVINGKEITEEDIKKANGEYQSLSDLVLWSLPDVLLQPLLMRLRLDVNHNGNEQSAKKWLLTADPALRSVVSKEALQWKKGAVTQEELALRQKAKQHVSYLLDEMCNAINKLRILDEEWPVILREIVRNTLLDYSQLDIYMKKKIQELK